MFKGQKKNSDLKVVLEEVKKDNRFIEILNPETSRLTKFDSLTDIKRNLSPMLKYLIKKVWDIYGVEECLFFWEPRNIRFNFRRNLAIKQEKRKKTSNEYPDIYTSFPMKVQFVENEIDVTYSVPHKEDSCYELFDYLEKPRSLEKVDEILTVFAKKYELDKEKYLYPLINRFSKVSLDGKYRVNLDTLHANLDAWGFFTYPDFENEVVAFHVGRKYPEVIQLLIFISKFGLTKFLIGLVLVEPGFVTDGYLRNTLKSLRDSHKIIQNRYIFYNNYKINTYFHDQIAKKQHENRKNGCWILQIERYSPVPKYTTNKSTKTNTIMDAINDIKDLDDGAWKWEHKWNPKKYDRPKNHGFIDKLLLGISLTIRMFDENGVLVKDAFEGKSYQKESISDIQNRKFLFYKASSPKGHLIFKKEKIKESNFFDWLEAIVHSRLFSREVKSEEGKLNHQNAFQAMLKDFEKKYSKVKGKFLHPTERFIIKKGSDWITPEIDAIIKYSDEVKDINWNMKTLLVISIKLGGYSKRDIDYIEAAAEKIRKTYGLLTKFNAHGCQIHPVLLVDRKDDTFTKSITIFELNQFGFTKRKYNPDFDTTNLEVVCDRIAQKIESPGDYNINKEIHYLREYVTKEGALVEEKLNGDCAVAITDKNGDLLTRPITNKQTDVVFESAVAGSKQNCNFFILPDYYVKQFKKFKDSTFKLEIIYSEKEIVGEVSRHFNKFGYVDLNVVDPICMIVVLEVIRYEGVDYIDPNFSSSLDRRFLLEQVLPPLSETIMKKGLLSIPNGIIINNTTTSMEQLKIFYWKVRNGEFYPNLRQYQEVFPNIAEGIVIKNYNYSLRKKTLYNSFIKVTDVVTYDLLVYAIRKIVTKNKIVHFQGILVAQDTKGDFHPVVNCFVSKRYLLGSKRKDNEDIIIRQHQLNNLDGDWEIIKDYDIILRVNFKSTRSSNTIKAAVIPDRHNAKRSGVRKTRIQLISTILEEFNVSPKAKKDYHKTNKRGVYLEND